MSYFLTFCNHFTCNSIFSGETIEAKTHEDVTMLFSDIVGFTSICSTATPMMVINMLQELYNQFDIYCGQLDVYKVRSSFFRGHYYLPLDQKQTINQKYNHNINNNFVYLIF